MKQSQHSGQKSWHSRPQWKRRQAEGADSLCLVYDFRDPRHNGFGRADNLYAS